MSDSAREDEDPVAGVRRPARALAAASAPVFRFTLFVAGSTPRSVQAIRTTRRLCEQHLAGRYSLEVVDVYQQPARLAQAEVVAVPTLVKDAPPPRQLFVGDLSDSDKFLAAVGVAVGTRERDCR